MAQITIPLYYDLDLLLWTSAAGGIARQPNLVLGQSDEIDFAVQFVRGGVGVNLPPITSIICGIKAINDVSGDYLANTTSVTQTGDGATRIYTFTLLLDSVELRAWLLTVTAVSNYAAFSILSAEHNIATLPAITCTILPDYNLTGTTPTAASGTLIVDSGQTFTVHKTFAMPVDDGTDTYVLKTNGAGVGRWAADSAGTGTVTNVAVTTANGVSGTVANPTASAAITLTLGAITPTSSTVSGNVSVGGDLIATSLKSTAGNQTLLLLPVASSVNYVAVEPSLTTLPVHIYAQGADTNIGLHLSPKGTGFVNVQDGTDTTKRLRFDASGNSSAIITTLASSSTTSQTITLPNATGATTLAGLQMVQTFSAAQTFSSTVGLTLGTDATNSTTGGTLTVTGGAAVSKKLFVGSLLDIVATTSTAGQITQAGSRLLHTFGGAGNLWFGLTTGNTASTLTGGNNIGIGTNAGVSMTSGANNMLIGGNSGQFITSGYNNVAIGISAGYNIGTGILNVAVGYSALQFGGNGGYNVAIGQSALQNITSGTLNTCIGSTAGNVDTVVVGGLTGKNITSGGNNTLIGAGAGTTSATGTYRTAIGSDSRCQNDNAIKLGRDTLDVVILPSMTTAQRNAVTSPAGGSLIFNTSTGKLNFWNSTAATPAWEAVTSA